MMPTPNGVATLGGTKYAVGLEWQPTDGKNIAKSAKEAARDPGYNADFYCARPSSKARPVAQFGLGQKELGHKNGMPVGAACLANNLPGSWLGAFKVPEGIWVVVVRDDLVDSDGDRFFDSDIEAQMKLQEELARGGIAKIYAPVEWGIDGADPVPIAMLLTGRKDIKLVGIDSDKNALFMLMGLLVLIAGGYFAWSQYEAYQQRLAEEEAARQAALEEERRRIEEQALALQGVPSLSQMPVQVTPPWPSKPLPMPWVEACGAAFAKVPLEMLGWKISSADCSETGLSANWTRIPGFAILPDAPISVEPENASSASLSVPFDKLAARGEQELWDPLETMAYFLANNWPATLSRLPDDPPPMPPNPDPNAPPPPPVPWVKRGVSFTLQEPPWHFVHHIQQINGLVLTKASWSPGGQWTLEGIIYENREPKRKK